MKKLLLILGVVAFLVAISLGGNLNANNANNRNNKPETKYINYSSKGLGIDFEYPEDWKIEFSSDDNDFLLDRKVDLETGDGFSLTVRLMKILKFPICDPTHMCGSPLIEPRIYYNLNYGDFENIGNVDGKKLYVSNTGATRLTWKEKDSPDGKYLVEQPDDFATNFVFEEKGNKITENLTIFGHEGSKKALFIYYGFRDNQTIKKWPEYKEILKYIIASMKSK